MPISLFKIKYINYICHVNSYIPFVRTLNNEIDMKNYFIILIFLLLATSLFAEGGQKQYYEYNIFSFSNITNKMLTMDVDNGNKIEKIKDEKGKKIWFKTPAAALNYLMSLGWEFYTLGESSGSTYQGTGSGSTIYWVMRRPCTKEEFEKAVQEGIAK